RLDLALRRNLLRTGGMKRRGIDPGPNSIPGPGSGRTHLLAQEYEPHNSRPLLVPGGHYLAPDWRPAVGCIPWLDDIPTTPLIANRLVRCGRLLSFTRRGWPATSDKK